VVIDLPDELNRRFALSVIVLSIFLAA